MKTSTNLNVDRNLRDDSRPGYFKLNTSRTAT